MGLFSRSKQKLPRAVAFVDYEHWYISLDKMYHVKPDIAGWVEDMSKTLNVQEIYFFADFSKSGLREEIPKIRGFSNKIIETGSMTTRVQKDFTDFIMLDHIYQEVMSRPNENDVFVIFTGDGHFYSVVSFLKNICKKTVGIYAVRNALSSQLRLTANWCVEYPNDREKHEPYFRAIFSYLAEAENADESPTFLHTVDEVSRLANAPLDEVRAAIQWLCDKGYIRREQLGGGSGRVTVITVDWHSVIRDDLWIPERGAKMPAGRSKQPAKKKTEQKPAEKKTEPKPAEKKPAEKKTEPKPAEKKPAEKKTEQKPAEKKPAEKKAEPKPVTEEAPAENSETPKPKRKRRRRRSSAKKTESAASEPKPEEKPAEPKPIMEGEEKPKPKRRRRRKSKPASEPTNE